MANGRGRLQWAPVAELVALVYNTLCKGKNADPVTANEINPYAEYTKPELERITPDQLGKLLGAKEHV